MLNPLSTCNKVTRVCAAIYLTSFCYLLLQENSGSSALPSVAIIIMNNWVVSIRAQCPCVAGLRSVYMHACTPLMAVGWSQIPNNQSGEWCVLFFKARSVCTRNRGEGGCELKDTQKDPNTIRKEKYRNTHGKDLIRYQQISSCIKEINHLNHGHPNDAKGQVASWQ